MCVSLHSIISQLGPAGVTRYGRAFYSCSVLVDAVLACSRAAIRQCPAINRNRVAHAHLFQKQQVFSDLST